MFKVETWVGPKFGGWFPGTIPYPSEMDAEAAIVNARRGEAVAKATPMKRRVMPA